MELKNLSVSMQLACTFDALDLAHCFLHILEYLLFHPAASIIQTIPAPVKYVCTQLSTAIKTRLNLAARSNIGKAHAK